MDFLIDFDFFDLLIKLIENWSNSIDFNRKENEN